MATTDAIKGKNALITAASMVGAVAVEFLLERRAGGAKKKVSDAVAKLPGKSGDLMDDLGRGVSSVARKATDAVRGDGDDDDRGDDAHRLNDDDERGLDELAERRREREERRQRRRQAS